jgi:hypothetical protein
LLKSVDSYLVQCTSENLKTVEVVHISALIAHNYNF